MGLGELAAAIGKAYLGFKAIETGWDALRTGLGGINGELRGLEAKRVAVSDLKRGGRGKAMVLKTYPVYSIEDRIRYIRQMTQKGLDDPRIRAIATSVITKECGKGKDGETIWCTPEKDHRAEVEAIFRAVKRRVRYVRDIVKKDTYQSPIRSWEMRASDCDDFSSLLAALLGSVGYTCRFRVIKTKKASDWDHIFLLVKMPKTGQLFPLDASVNKPPGWHPPREMIAQMRDFDV